MKNIIMDGTIYHFRPICGYKLVGVIPHKKLIMRHTNPFSSPSDAVRNDLLRK